MLKNNDVTVLKSKLIRDRNMPSRGMAKTHIWAPPNNSESLFNDVHESPVYFRLQVTIATTLMLFFLSGNVIEGVSILNK